MIFLGVFSPAEAVRSAIQAAAPVPSVPERVQAVAGSCVVIPCTFTPSDAILGLWRRRVGVRMSFRTRSRFSLRSIAFNSENKGQVSEQFQDRVSLFGTTSGGDCSLWVEQIQRNDAKEFEISLKRREDEHWGRERRFALEVLGESGGYGASQIKAAAGEVSQLNHSHTMFRQERKSVALKREANTGGRSNKAPGMCEAAPLD